MDDKYYDIFQHCGTQFKKYAEKFSDNLENEEIKYKILKENSEIYLFECCRLITKYQKKNAQKWFGEIFGTQTDNIKKCIYDNNSSNSISKYDYIQAFLVMLDCLEAKDIEGFFREIFVEGRENPAGESSRMLGDAYYKLRDNDSNEADPAYRSNWKRTYCRNIKKIASLFEDGERTDFYNGIEEKMRSEKFRAKDGEIDNEEVLSYFYELQTQSAFRAMECFIDRLEYEDSNLFLFGWDTRESIAKNLYPIESPKILYEAYKAINRLNNSYTVQQWYKDIHAINEEKFNVDVYNWMEVQLFISDVLEFVKNKNYKEGMEYIEKNQTLRMFDLTKIKSIPYIIAKTAELIDLLLLENTLDIDYVLSYINVLGEKNIYNYQHVRSVETSYMGYEKKSNALRKDSENNKKLKKKFFDILSPEGNKEINIKKILDLYFNSHLKYRIDLADIVFRVNKYKDKKSSLAKIFSEYPIYGKIVHSVHSSFARKYEADSIHDKVKLEPINIYTRVRFEDVKKRIEENRVWKKELFAELNKIMRCDREWYGTHDDFVTLLNVNDECTFKICKYSKDGFIVVKDIKCTFDIEEQRKEDLKEYADYVWKWLENIRENNANNAERCIPTFYQNVYDIKYLQDIEIRRKIAIEILRIFGELKKSEDIDELLDMLEKNKKSRYINEFRYYKQQRTNNKEVWFGAKEKQNIEYIIRQKIWERTDITDELKVRIFKNTCARKVIPLEEVFLRFPETTKYWVTPVKHYKYNKEKVVFKAQYKDSIFITDKLFERQRDENVKISSSKIIYGKDDTIDIIVPNNHEQLYYASELTYDEGRECFIAKKSGHMCPVYIVDKFLPILYDTKHDFEKKIIGERLEKIEITELDNHIDGGLLISYLKELDSSFNLHGYRASECKKIIDAMGKYHELFISKVKNEKINLSKEQKAKIIEKYEKFMEINEKNSWLAICEVYYNSFYGLVISEECFWKKIESFENTGEQEVEAIRNYCIDEGYINVM